MRLALFDDYRLGRVSEDGASLVDVTHVVPDHRPDPTSGWWRRLCRDFDTLAPLLRDASGETRSLADVRLLPSVLNPGKVIACAVNYREHVEEMRDSVLPRTGSDNSAWMLQFDVFLKAPSSVIGPSEPIVLPESLVSAGKEIHHESELTLVIGRGGSSIPANEAMSHILGYTIGLDITERGEGDRSRRKSWDTFTPIGPWLTTADRIPDPGALMIHLEVDGAVKQHSSTADMIVDVPGIIAYASSVMRLEPGDVILTGAPAGVGEIHDGEIVEASIDGLGTLRMAVTASVARNATI